jgi:hypothetical protein
MSLTTPNINEKRGPARRIEPCDYPPLNIKPFMPVCPRTHGIPHKVVEVLQD